MTDGAILAFYIGPSVVVGGVNTDMVAWANKDVFLQIWIGIDDKLPRRVRAVYAADPLQLRHELELSNWKLDDAIPAEAFTSQKALAAPRIAFRSPTAERLGNEAAGQDDSRQGTGRETAIQNPMIGVAR